MPTYKKVSIIIPIFNEAKTLQTLLSQVKAASTLGLEREIILIDDCSTDNTRQILESLNDPIYQIIYHKFNQGKGGALHTGFENATGDIVVVQDADLEYDPGEIQQVLRPFLESTAKV